MPWPSPPAKVCCQSLFQGLSLVPAIAATLSHSPEAADTYGFCLRQSHEHLSMSQVGLEAFGLCAWSQPRQGPEIGSSLRLPLQLHKSSYHQRFSGELLGVFWPVCIQLRQNPSSNSTRVGFILMKLLKKWNKYFHHYTKHRHDLQS